MMILLLFIILQLVNGLNIAIGGLSRECFELQLAHGETLTGSFSLLTAGAKALSFFVTNKEDNARKLEFVNTEKANWVLEASHTSGYSGTYDACFENGERIPVHVGFAYHSSAVPDTDVATDAHTKELESAVIDMISKVASMNRQQQFAATRATRHRMAASVTAKMAGRWTLIKTLVAVGTVAAEIYYIRSFFDVKAVV